MSFVKNPFQDFRDKAVTLLLSPWITCPSLPAPLLLQSVTFKTLFCTLPQCLHLWLLEQSLWLPVNEPVSGRDRGDLGGGDRGVRKHNGCLTPGHGSEASPPHFPEPRSHRPRRWALPVLRRPLATDSPF